MKKKLPDMGTFEWEGEVFAWAPCADPRWFGFFEVVDSHDFVLSTAMTAESAVLAAKQELEFYKHSVADVIYTLLIHPEEQP